MKRNPYNRCLSCGRFCKKESYRTDDDGNRYYHCDQDKCMPIMAVDTETSGVAMSFTTIGQKLIQSRIEQITDENFTRSSI